MSLIATVSMTQIKRGKGEYIRGKWVHGENIENLFRGTFQPETGQILELLPEGKRDREVATVFSPISMLWTPADTENEETGDLISYDNKLYEVIQAHKWKNGLINHWELLVCRLPPSTLEVEDED